MAHANVVDAVRTRLAAGFDRCEITKDGDASTSGRQHPFLAVDFPHSSARQASAGAPGVNVYREEGGILFRLFVPRRSIAEGRRWADEIGDLFRGKRFDNVTTSAPTSPGTDNRNDASGFYELAFVVPYRFDLLG